MESAGHERPTDISGCTCVLHIFLAHAQYYGSSWGVVSACVGAAWERCGSRGQVSARPAASWGHGRTGGIRGGSELPAEGGLLRSVRDASRGKVLGCSMHYNLATNS